MTGTTTSIRVTKNIPQRQCFFSKPGGILCFFLWTIILLSTTSTTVASSSSSSSHYESMQVLTSQGTSRQLQHAHKASQQGRWILAFALNTTTTTTTTTSTPKDGEDNSVGGGGTSTPCPPHASPTILVLSRGPTPVLHRMTPISSTSSFHHHHHHQQQQRSSSSPTVQKIPLVAMACTGLAGDAQWLIRQVQSRLMELWETYDHFITSLPVLAHGIAHWCNVYRTSGLVGRPTKSLWASTSSSSNEWTRPLGVEVLLVSTGGSSQHHHASSSTTDPLYLLSMPPTGRIHRGKRPESTAATTTTTTTTTTNIVLEYLCLGGSELQRAEWDKKCQALLNDLEHVSTSTRSSDDSEETLVDTILQALGLHEQQQQQQQQQQVNDPNSSPLWIETLHPSNGLIQRKYEYPMIPPQPSRRRIF